MLGVYPFAYVHCVCMCIFYVCALMGFLLHVASEMAMDEIKSLSEKLETEQALRREAERIAHQVRNT